MADMKKWHQNTKKRLQEETKLRVSQRTQKLETVIQYKFYIAYKMPFRIHDTAKHQMNEQILKAIKNRNIPSNCKSQKDCYDKTRVWWHRDKSKHLGPHLFSPIIFQLLFKTIIKSEQMEPNIKKRIIFFIDTFICILNEDIKFPLSGAKPVISNHIFLESNNNIFKDNCLKFLQYFGNGIQWKFSSKKTKIIHTKNGSKTEYQKDKNRANNAKQSFINALQKIKINIESQSEEIIKQQIQNWNSFAYPSDRLSNIITANTNNFHPATNPPEMFPIPMTVPIPPPTMPPTVNAIQNCNNCHCFYYNPIHQQSQQYRTVTYSPYHPYAYRPMDYNPYSYHNNYISHGQRMYMQGVLPETYQSQINSENVSVNNQCNIPSFSNINSNSPLSITPSINYYESNQANNTQIMNGDSNLIDDCSWMFHNTDSSTFFQDIEQDHDGNNTTYI